MLTSLFRRLTGRAAFAAPAPEMPLCVIGDVHGCLTQLEALLSQVPSDHRVVLVGDYVDRGENSAGVLRLVSARRDFTCLMGNHEDMLLQFLKDPHGEGARWLRFGGLQTLASFGVSGVRSDMSPDELTDCRDKLQTAMGASLVQWLTDLETQVFTGNVLVVHAGADPAVAPADQKDKTLIWGHPSFPTTDRRDGVWVVHGHTIVTEAQSNRGRIAVDTGAFATGRLSAVCLDGSEPRFLTT
ncbi:metallophosphoesterase family protein [Ruegeria sp.]|uniref:metallophosphoesterase family protein n=1 Tax=Ruegeria sp. TaxID=1879320 RepID=UPI003B5C718D